MFSSLLAQKYVENEINFLGTEVGRFSCGNRDYMERLHTNVY